METAELSPFVYWSQTKQTLSLKVDLKDAKGVITEFTPTTLSFSANGTGARGVNAYRFRLKFYERIEEESATYTVTDHKIEISIRKEEPGWWVRLVATPQKPHWLKVDFDRWHTEEDAEIPEPAARDVREDYAEEYQNLQKKEIGYVREKTKKVYLVIYNLAMFVGYLHILIVMGVMYLRDGPDSIKHAYEYVGTSFKFVQLMQYMEVSGRNFVLFLMIEMEPRMHAKPVVFYVFTIWALVEIVRYPYYVSQLLQRENGLLTWLRYTIWIPLYPAGIVCEGIILLRSIPYIEETQRFCIDMPNKWNITFDMVLFLKVYLLLLALPGSYLVMSHMSKLRVKKLGRGRAKAKKN